MKIYHKDNKKKAYKNILNNHFSKKREGDCGENAVKSILSMYGTKLNKKIATKEGASPNKITDALKRKALKVLIKQKIEFEDIKPKSIAYYPKDDHYVAIEKVKNNKILVNDSSEPEPQWLLKKMFTKRWNGWTIETRRRK